MTTRLAAVVRKLRRPSPLQYAYLAVAVPRLLAAHLVFRLSSTQRLLERATRPRRAPARPGGSGFDIETALWAIDTAARHVPWRADCMIRSLAAARWLARHGYAPRFHLGVLKSDAEEIRAHAWLTLDGRVIVGGDIHPGDVFTPILPESGDQVHERGAAHD